MPADVWQMYTDPRSITKRYANVKPTNICPTIPPTVADALSDRVDTKTVIVVVESVVVEFINSDLCSQDESPIAAMTQLSLSLTT